ncbi:TonB-dependent receptor, partial [Nostoc linckia z16]
MKIHVLLVLLFGSLISMHAQNPGNISGKIIDKATGQPLPYVNVIVKDNGTVLTGGITEDNGEFNVTGLPLKDVTVELQFMGYKTQVLAAALSEATRSVSLGTLTMAEEATTLSEVEIVKEVSTIEQKLDRKVITVGRDLTTAGGTAAEI